MPDSEPNFFLCYDFNSKPSGSEFKTLTTKYANWSTKLVPGVPEVMGLIPVRDSDVIMLCPTLMSCWSIIHISHFIALFYFIVFIHVINDKIVDNMEPVQSHSKWILRKLCIDCVYLAVFFLWHDLKWSENFRNLFICLMTTESETKVFKYSLSVVSPQILITMYVVAFFQVMYSVSFN